MSWPQYLRREMTIEGLAVKLSKTAAEAVAILLLRRGQMVAACDLVGMIWPDPDAEPRDPEQVLYHVLWSLGRNFPGLIETNGRQTHYLRYAQRHGRCYMIARPKPRAVAA